MLMMTSNTKNSESAEDQFFNYLPEKLRRHLLPFQREGVAFGIRRNGRYSEETRTTRSRDRPYVFEFRFRL